VSDSQFVLRKTVLFRMFLYENGLLREYYYLSDRFTANLTSENYKYYSIVKVS
jgi:hypothetical protein